MVSNSELERISILICTPQYGGMCFGDYTYACIQLQKLCMEYQVPIEFAFVFNESLIQRGRNELVHKFMNSKDFNKEDYTHLVFIDADIGFKPEDVLRLVVSNKDIIGGTYPRKRINWDNVKHALKLNPNISQEELEVFAADYIFKVKDGIESFDIHSPVEVDNIPTGFLCIKKQVFLEFQKNFESIKHMEFNTLSGIPEERFAYFETGINEKNEYLSEDFWFCMKAREIGFQPFMLPDICLNHNGTYKFRGNPPLLAQYMSMEHDLHLKIVKKKNKGTRR